MLFRSMVRRGLNVALGVPLARNNETVLSIRKYHGSGQYIVITDLNSYLLPFGLTPTVAEGDTLTVGDEVTTWVEVKDYMNDGDWWINLEIPKSLMPYVPADQPDSYAKPGSYADYLMRTYLKHHTFLIKVNVTTFKNVESFQQLGDIIRKIKPTYTTPIYIWSVPIDDEIIYLIEDSTSTRRDTSRCELVFSQIRRMRRNAADPVHRGCPKFLRTSLGQHEYSVLGLDPYTNGIPMPVAGGTATGFVNRPHAFRNNTGYEIALLRAKFRRNERNIPHNRSKVVYARNNVVSGNAGDFYDPWRSYIPSGMFSVPLYLTTLADLQDRFRGVNVPVPDNGPVFTLMQPYWTDGSINDIGIDEGVVVSQFQVMIQQYDIVFNKGTKGDYLGNFVPDFASASYKPPVTYLKDTDFFLCTQVYENTYAVYWITSSTAGFATENRSVWLMPDNDVIKIAQANMPMARGLGPAINAPIYMTRGGNLVSSMNYVTDSLDYSINRQGVNEEGSLGESDTILYSDTVNLYVPKTRGSAKIQVDAILGADINPST